MRRFIVPSIIFLISNILCDAQTSYRLMSSERILVDDRYDASVSRSGKRYLLLHKARIDRELNTVVANAAKEIDAGDPVGLLNYFCVDAMFSQMNRIVETPLDMAVVNNHAFRKALPEGPVTLANVYEALPFDNEVVVLKMKGQDVKRLLNTIARRGSESFSNARIVVKDNKLQSAYIGGTPLDTERIYTVITIDYLAEGSGGMTAFKKALEKQYTKVFLRDLIVREMEVSYRAGKLLSPVLDNRFHVVEAKMK